MTDNKDAYFWHEKHNSLLYEHHALIEKYNDLKNVHHQLGSALERVIQKYPDLQEEIRLTISYDEE